MSHKLFEGFEMGFEGLAAGLCDGEGGVGFAADETFLALDVAQLLQGPRVAGQVAVGEGEELFEGGKIGALVDHEHGHDAKASFAFEGLVEAVERGESVWAVGGHGG